MRYKVLSLQSVRKISDQFLSGVFPEGNFEFKGPDFKDFGTHPLELIYVRTGGAEGIFKNLLPEMLARGIERYYLLTSGQSNSLAASLEILSYLRQQGLKGEVLHGPADYLQKRVKVLETVAKARERLQGMRLGVIGQPSDWLISSHADPVALSYGGTAAGNCQGPVQPGPGRGADGRSGKEGLSRCYADLSRT